MQVVLVFLVLATLVGLAGKSIGGWAYVMISLGAVAVTAVFYSNTGLW